MKTKGLLILALVAMSFSVSAQAWRQQYTNMTGSTTYVDQIAVVDSNIVWVNGTNGSSTVDGFINAHSRTNDGGETWVPGTYNGIASTVDIRVLAASSYTNAFAIAMDTVSSVASFWKTIDGGANWSLVTGVMNTGSTTFADGVSFWDSSKGFCYGDPVSGKFDIYYTTDGGTTWTPTLAANTAAPVAGEYGYNGAECAAKANNGVGAFITNKGRVYRTTDYGITWDTTAVAPFASCPYSNIISMSSANFIIVGNLPTNTSSAYDYKYTTDGGATWNTYAAASGTFYTYKMCYVPGTANMFVATSPYSTGDKGVGYATDGLNWADYYDATFLQDVSAVNMQMLGVAFADSSNGWVGNYNYFGGENSILRYQRNNSTRFSVVASALQVVTGVDAGTLSGIANYNSGASVTLTATPLTGYIFEKWISYPDQTDLGTNATYTFTMPASNVAVLASFIADPDIATAYLSDLKVNGTTISGFSATTYVYNVVLPAGTTTVPTVTATASNTGATIDYVHATSLPGVDSVKVTAPNGTTKLNYLVNFTVAPTGISENEFGKLLISPNPATNNVTIALNSKQNGVFNVNIVDLTGKSVYTNSLEANATMNVDVTAFAKGVYFVKINNDKTQFVQKLIVK